MEQAVGSDSDAAQSIHVIVNGRQKVVNTRFLTAWDLVRLAFTPVPQGDNFLFTITYRNGPQQNPKGTLTVAANSPSEDPIYVSNGMLFSVTATDKS